ncbi:MAG: cysteine--tRNA ligase [Bacteroidetes bacterium]|nr:cysteine--tRNA ligase [Bacteroidota bacterium]
MKNKDNFQIYNTLSRKKEIFIPINPPYVGMYLCGPTVYSDSHLGHARSAITFDILVRYLNHLNYKVKYIRNITDVGHLERDADEGEDKMAKKARIEKLDVMEVASKYTNSYHKDLQKLNTLKPNIEPIATGHIIEQIELIKTIIKNNLAYEVNGSVYFDVKNYSNKHNYGILSGRKIEELLSNTRNLSGQSDKRYPLDFALWKKASPEHIMRWPSPWGEGFPGWHLECSAMSFKYLGNHFDIHGGGMELSFPHHECEIAQSLAANDVQPAKYWMHHNMVTIDGKKMSKSLNNFITLDQLFNGSHPLLDKPYSPMVLRYFILQAHYRSTISFSVEALKSAEKGYIKLLNTFLGLNKLILEQTTNTKIDTELLKKLDSLYEKCYDYMNDDLNTARIIATLFDVSKVINLFINGQQSISILGKDGFEKLKNTFAIFFFEILGLIEQESISKNDLLNIILSIYKDAKLNKKYDIVDQIRADLKNNKIIIEDRKTGEVDWKYE